MPYANPPLVLLEQHLMQELSPGRVYRRRGSDGAWRRVTLRQGKLYVRSSEDTGAEQYALAEPVGQVLRLGRRSIPLATKHTASAFQDVFDWQGFRGRSRSLRTCLGRLASAAFCDAPLFVHGESGTGKELAARALHEAGPRRQGPFVVLNCAALPEPLAEAELFGARRGAYTGASVERPGAFARAHGGTLFLDEVGDLPYGIQGKLLRALEQGEAYALGADRPSPFDVRVVSATWRDLHREVSVGRFRFDLLQRLGVLELHMPPLRERPEDVAPLLAMALSTYGAMDLWPDPDLLRALERFDWPGNVRQLRNLAQRSAVWGEPIRVPEGRRHRVQQDEHPGQRWSSPRERVHDALDRARGNRSAAARTLGVSRSTLYRWISPQSEGCGVR